MTAAMARTTGDRALQWSLAGHGLLAVIVLIGGISLHRAPPPSQLAIKATVVESRTDRRPRTAPTPAPRTRAEPNPAPKPEPKPEAKPEPKPAPKPAPKVEAPPPRPKPDPALEQRKAEEQKLKTQKLEKDKAEAKREQARREKQQADQAAEKQRQEKAAAERAKAEADRAEAKRAEAAEAAARERELAEEEQLLAAADSGALADYVAVIRQKVERNWVRPPGAKPGLECEVLVTQIPGGQVTAVQRGRCNADDAVWRSIEAAVMKASPLPPPDDATLFERNLRFSFKPEQ